MMGATLPPGEAGREPLAKVFHDTLLGYLRALPSGRRRLWLLVPLSGAIPGVGAVALVHLLSLVQALAWGSGASLLEETTAAGPLRRVGLPLVAGGVVVLTSSLMRGFPEGHGTSGIIEAIWVRRGQVPLIPALVRGALTILVVGLGASLGREGALIYFGAASASALGRRFGLGVDQLKLLVACGASAGLAAAYNTPVGGALFGLEVLLGGLSLELYGPLIVAAVTATLVSRTLLYDHPSYLIPPIRLHRPGEIILYVALGAVVGALSGLFVWVVEGTARAAHAAPTWLKRVLPLVGLGAVGVAGLRWPQLYGNGYDTVNDALTGALPLRLALGLPLAKLMLSGVCASSGAPGGLFTPSLFVGALAGDALGTLAHRLVPTLAPAPSGFALVGMAAILAGSTHATLAAALMLFELTGSYDLILPLLAASVASTVVSRRIAAESIYTAPLVRRGVELPRIRRPAWMQREGVRRLLRVDAPLVPPDATIGDVLVAMATLREGEPLHVVDREGRLRGLVSSTTVRQVMAEEGDLGLLVAFDLMQPAAAISVDASLWEATRRALAAEAEALAVVAPHEGGRFVGVVRIDDVLAAARAAP
jgi:CIC family chloride channel protein